MPARRSTSVRGSLRKTSVEAQRQRKGIRHDTETDEDGGIGESHGDAQPGRTAVRQGDVQAPRRGLLLLDRLAHGPLKGISSASPAR